MEQYAGNHDFFRIILGGKMYTIKDIENLPDGERAELIDGKMYMMACPTAWHQLTITWLNSEIFNFIKSKNGKCKTIPAPFAVFPKNDEINYVEPDITVICNTDRLDTRGCHGAPEWIIEVVSPSSGEMDYESKKGLYEEAGVLEYWIIDLNKKCVLVHNFKDGSEPEEYTFDDVIEAASISGLQVNFKDLESYLQV